MSSSIGKNIKISIFGQSHSKAIGVTIDGLPSGFKIDIDELQQFMSRRAPGKNDYSTKRNEADKPEFISGLVENTTCGAPLTAIIYNNNQHSSDYKNIIDVPRPGHADFTAQVKYNGFQDVAGGGHFSGRLTAPLCVAGGIIKQILSQKGIDIFAHIFSIANIKDEQIDMANPDKQKLLSVQSKDFPTVCDKQGEAMKEKIIEAKNNLNSVGGTIECFATGVPTGIGEPMFEGMENKISNVVFAVPAVKAIEFGNGFDCAELTGFENNDEFFYDSKIVKTRTNNHGGILGGITSGMPIVFRVAVKPTPSIGKEQHSISFSKKKNAVLNIKGRHDPCIVQRAVPCIEAACAIAIYDAMLDNKN